MMPLMNNFKIDLQLMIDLLKLFQEKEMIVCLVDIEILDLLIKMLSILDGEDLIRNQEYHLDFLQLDYRK